MEHFRDTYFKIWLILHILFVFEAKLHILKEKLTQLKFN